MSTLTLTSSIFSKNSIENCLFTKPITRESNGKVFETGCYEKRVSKVKILKALRDEVNDVKTWIVQDDENKTLGIAIDARLQAGAISLHENEPYRLHVLGKESYFSYSEESSRLDVLQKIHEVLQPNKLYLNHAWLNV